MGVPATPGVHIDMEQIGPIDRKRHGETGFLGRLPERRIPRILTGIDVASRLQPHTETSMFEQDCAALPDHDR